MRDRYRLHLLLDAELIVALSLLAHRDNKRTADLLAHLAELDERKLYLELGFRSIWEYCTVGLWFCETTAWRRYTAARVCRRRSLELDHIEPRAAGGLETRDDLRLRCRAHNQHYARQYFGRGYMGSVMKRVRAQRVGSV